MGIFERFVLVPSVCLGVLSSCALLLIIFYDDAVKFNRRYKRSVSFRAMILGRVIMYGLLGLLGVVVHFI